MPLPILRATTTPQVVLGITDFLKTAALWTSIATVLVTWLKVRHGRKVTITTKDKSVIHIEGMSVADVERLLKNSIIVSAIESNEKEPISENKENPKD